MSSSVNIVKTISGFMVFMLRVVCSIDISILIFWSF